MVTQILEFNATSGLTIVGKLFAQESDTIVASVTAVEKTNDKNRYRISFTDIPAGNYRLNGFVGSVGGYVNEVYVITLENDVFLPLSEQTSSQQTEYGSETYLLTLLDSGSNPISGAECYLTSDAGGGTAVTPIKTTNASGKASFRVNPGTYYVWVSHPNYTFNLPITITVNNE